MRTVEFNNIVNVVLIPCRREYFDTNLSEQLWWETKDLDRFRIESLSELNVVINLCRNKFEDELKCKKMEATQQNFIRLAQNKVYQLSL